MHLDLVHLLPLLLLGTSVAPAAPAPPAPPAAPPAPPAPPAPAAVPAPAPAAPAAPAAPGAPEPPKKNPIRTALDAAKSALTGGKGLGVLASEREAARQAAAIAPPPPAPAPGAPEKPHHAATQPRKEDGTFVNPDGSQKPGEAAPDPAADPAAPEAIPTGAEGAETLDQLSEEEKKLVVTLPARREGEEPEHVVMPDEATADRMRQLLNGYQRAETLRAEREGFSQQREQFEADRTEMQVDPIGYILDEQRSGVSAKQRVNLALTILTEEGVWTRASSVLKAALGNPDVLGRLRAEAKAERADLREQAVETVNTQRELSRNARQIHGVVERLTDAFDDTQRELVYRDCLNDIKEFVRDKQIRLLDPRYVPQILQRRLGLYGITAEQIQAALSARSAAPARRPAAPAPGSPPAPPAAPKQPTAADLRKGSERRAAAAAAAPAGVGAPGSGVTAPPKGSTLKQAFSFARQQTGRPK